MTGKDRYEFELAFGGENEDEDICISIGTNEDIECTKGEYLEACEFTEITSAQEDIIKDLIELDECWAPNSVWQNIDED